MYLSKTLFNIISLTALAVVGVSAQDDGPGFVTKCTTPGQVALTFDDGPSPFTEKLLGYLNTAKVPATFFVLGISIQENGKALKSAFDAGHQIALHSNTHADMNTLTAQAIKDEYTINLKAVKDTIGVEPIMARPPYGNCNENCAKVLTGEMGLTVIQWNCDSNDWQYEANVADQPKLFTNIADIINPSNPKTDSFITLQHDIKDYSVEYVPKIIELIKGKGYTFVTVEQCLGGTIPAYKGKDAGPAPAAGEPANAPADAPPADAPPADAPPADAPPAEDPPKPEPAYLAADSSPSAAPADAPKASDAPKAPDAPNSAGKISSTFGLTLLGLALSLLY